MIGNVPGNLPRRIARIAGVSVLAVLIGCAEKVEEAPVLITSTAGQPIVLTSNDITGVVAYETCVGRLSDKLLYVCILTQQEQSWARSALVNITYH